MATAKKNQKPAGEATKGIKVTARPAIFRRAGYTFTAEATVIPLDELSEEQLAQMYLQNEEMASGEYVYICRNGIHRAVQRSHEER